MTQEEPKIIIRGYAWKSKQNGAVYDVNGIAPTLTIGMHSGVEPFIYEDTESTIKKQRQ